MTYAAKIDPAERRLDPARPADELERVVRALHPHVGTYLELEGGARLGVTRAELAPGDTVAPGELAPRGGELLLGCEPGALRIAAVRPPGKREMAVADYLRGHPAPSLAPAVS
jgi:methionyl-tRNA formyltransferase